MTITTEQILLNKKMLFFYAVELISAVAFNYFQEFSGLIWLAVVISFLGIIPKLSVLSISFSDTLNRVIPQVCLILSSALWGYIILYSLTSAPLIYTAILVARIIATVVAFREIREHVTVVLPLLIGFALLKPAGCIPPIAF